ncbi:5-(carboxyamino)imidazole ribonucleotide synthase [Candidatus Pelagibacter bacterium]|nr:5-(carboxyamino)imidazole ribonucleotide synthase [Candidatus Pelagibacter bacterium]MDA9619173.1 5-(carboxyamino)imidazole ribonucleotide synthase [Candidatus Pelagibacter bacterium]
MSDSILGIIGSGQLGSMLCQAAKKLNVKTVVISDDEQGPAQKYADQFIFAKYDDQQKIKQFTDKADVVTFEFENIPISILKQIEKEKKVLPKPEINRIIQNRKLEKSFVNELGIETTKWSFIEKAEDVTKNSNLLPGILKTNTLGYDGQGQFVLKSLADVKKDWCFTADYILEKKVNLKKEISVIITRFIDGETFIYEPIENLHKDQILKHSKIPANINEKIYKQAQNNAQLIADKLDYVGSMCVEYFIDQEDNLLVNEIAPRVHNSGHLTINAFNISQFENHIRAVCGLKFEKPKKNSNAEMINILGKEIEEYRSKTFKEDEFFFDYGKNIIKEKRKMGHLTILKK